jgi:hypothetical protein
MPLRKAGGALKRGSILEAAPAIIDAEGLTALTMHRPGEELGVEDGLAVVAPAGRFG